jgi:hypothetical protein
MRGKS